MGSEQALSRGQRIKVGDLGLGPQPFILDLLIAEGSLVVDAACFGLDSGRKLADERYMTFFNQPESPCGGVKLASPHSFRFALDRLPTSIDALIVTLGIDGSGVMSALGGSIAKICTGAGRPGHFVCAGSVCGARPGVFLFATGALHFGSRRDRALATGTAGPRRGIRENCR